MDNREKIYELISKHDEALNKIAHPELDSLLRIPFEDCPYFDEKYSKKYPKAWFTIDPDAFFKKFMNKLIDLDPQFAKISSVFKNRLRSQIVISFCEENGHEDKFVKKTLKKYPSWAKFWHYFSLSAMIQGEFPWEDINDQIIYVKYNTYQKDNEQADLMLGFNFNEEYKRLKKLYPDTLLENQIQKHKNDTNKKVS